ncbi:MAG TPA: aminotransferase class IV [Gaiellaceae bacterium]|nr:aminotransferase class IV [Gaiellaceae bacterium]
MSGVAFVDGEYLAVEEARIPLLDWGFLRSDATYDVVHVWRGSFFRLADHVARFRRGMEQLRLALPDGLPPLEEVLHECVRRSGLRDAYVEMICTRGLPKPGSRDPREARNAFYAFAIPFVWIADETKQETGLALHVSERQRIPPRSVDPTVKNYHWLDLTVGLLEAYDAGAETVVLVDGAGNVVEGPGFNVFAVRDGALATAAEGVLEGVTRRTVLELAAELGIPVREGPLPAAELRAADEAFLTSTAGGVMPIGSVDGRRIPPGPLTRRLRDTYWALHDDPRYASPVAY